MMRKAVILLGVALSGWTSTSQAFLFPSTSFSSSHHLSSSAAAGSSAGGSIAGSSWIPSLDAVSSSSSRRRRRADNLFLSFSGASASSNEGGGKVSADQEIMEELITLSWDNLDEFANRHYKFLIHPQFYMQLADRIYQLPTQEEQDDVAAKATKIWNNLLKVLDAAEEQRTDTASLIERIVSQAAESDGSFYFPLSKDRVEAVRAEVIKNLELIDEGALITLNSWVVKVQDDQENQAMAEVLQKVFQYYAGGVLMRAKGYERPDTQSGSLLFLRNLLNADPDDWDMMLFNGLKVDAICGVEALTDEIAAMIQGVVLLLPEGSLQQRIQAEYLRELMSRVSRYNAQHPRAAF